MVKQVYMRTIRGIVHVYVKDSSENFYYTSAAAMFDDPRIQPLMGMAYKTFRKHKYGSEEPYENEHLIVKRGVLLTRDNDEGQTE